MDRDQAYMRMLGSTASMQWNLAIILEAKAEEAEKVRNWICNHITSDSFNGDLYQLKQSMQMHEQIIEVLDGVNKMNQGLVSVLRAVLMKDQSDGDQSDGQDYGDNH